MSKSKPFTIAYTPASDDAFYYDALENGLVVPPGFPIRFRRGPVADLNRCAEMGLFEVTAVSAVVYPRVADRYAILSAGASIGRGYGPVVAARDPCHLADLAGRRVGVAGIPTTGWFLLRSLCPGAIPVETPLDEMATAVASGVLDAGVMIHEELLYYPRVGLRLVADLGAEWCARNGLPLPVGLNLVRRDLGPRTMRRMSAAVRDSIRQGQDDPGAALLRVGRGYRGKADGRNEPFVRMFASDDSLALADDVRAALRVIFKQMVETGQSRVVPELDVVEPARVEELAYSN
ncbi:MqnA/MqnD/SBP family protein [Fimbriiglobus ruber]|uniref:Menaquinone via futalosine step 4 n=1 Tax=Fimbriiglobus ruber TaxID=1908690 RepID=A0A225DQN3_9BACT|nr:MqnA/MqnD/SBP family protein [Fimbriiglobus ruber]OWK43702.1 Menaquinone via futalosine step 4 [Fimbriiglobus ruber]